MRLLAGEARLATVDGVSRRPAVPRPDRPVLRFLSPAAPAGRHHDRLLLLDGSRYLWARRKWGETTSSQRTGRERARVVPSCRAPTGSQLCGPWPDQTLGRGQTSGVAFGVHVLAAFVPRAHARAMRADRPPPRRRRECGACTRAWQLLVPSATIERCPSRAVPPAAATTSPAAHSPHHPRRAFAATTSSSSTATARTPFAPGTTRDDETHALRNHSNWRPSR